MALSRQRATAWTLGAVYLPLLVMCLYTLGWVSCSHCKAAVWQLTPTAPGLFAYELSRQAVDLPHFSGPFGVATSIVLTLLSLAGIAAWLRHAGRWRIPVATVVVLASSWLAMALLSVVRA
jgi:Na+-translocating ferredoxin:NAD+ oxidoreductase RnfD subunit